MNRFNGAFGATAECEKELAKFCKKYRAFGNDVADVKELLRENIVPPGKGTAVLRKSAATAAAPAFLVAKIRLTCKEMQKSKRHSLRLVYAHLPEKNEIVFVELYAKGKKANEDRERIRRFLETLKNRYN